MTRRHRWSLLRGSGSATVAIGLFPVVLGLDLANLWNRGAPWRGEWAWTVDWVGSTTPIIGSLVAGVGAWLGWRRVASGRETIGTASRQWAPIILPWMTLTVSAVLAHSAATMVAFVVTASARPWGAPSLLAVVVQLIGLGAFGAAGTFAGILAPSRFIAPVTAALCLGASFYLEDFGIPPILDFGGASSTLADLRYSQTALLSQGAALAALLGFFLIVGVWRGSEHRMISALISLPAAAVVLVSIIVASDAMRERFVIDPAQDVLRCDRGQVVEVCLHPVHERFSDHARELLDRFLQPLVTLGVDVPQRFEEITPGREEPRSPGDGYFIIDFDAYSSGHLSEIGIASAIATPWGCPQLHRTEPPPTEFLSAWTLLIEYLLATAGAPPSDAPQEALRDFARGSQTSQRTWLAATFAKYRTCELEDVRLPEWVAESELVP